MQQLIAEFNLMLKLYITVNGHGPLPLANHASSCRSIQIGSHTHTVSSSLCILIYSFSVYWAGLESCTQRSCNVAVPCAGWLRWAMCRLLYAGFMGWVY